MGFSKRRFWCCSRAVVVRVSTKSYEREDDDDDKSEFFTSFSLLNLGSHFIRLIP